MLMANKAKKEKMAPSEDQTIVYVGDLAVSVLYLEEDEVYTVEVTKHDL